MTLVVKMSPKDNASRVYLTMLSQKGIFPILTCTAHEKQTIWVLNCGNGVHILGDGMYRTVPVYTTKICESSVLTAPETLSLLQ